MSVKKLPSGKWEVRVRDADGKERSHVERVKELAVKWERDFLTKRDHGEIVDPATLRITLKAYAEQWYKGQTYRPQSREAIEGILRNHIYPTFGSRRLVNIRPSEVKQWINSYDCAFDTRKARYGVLVSIMKAAVADRIITTSPCQVKFGRKPKDEAPLIPLTTEQVRALEAAVPDRFSAAFTFAAGSGLRPMEWCGLTLDRVDFLRREVRVDRQLLGCDASGHPVFGPPKSAAGFRQVPLAAEVIDVLAAHIALYGAGVDGLLFTTAQGRPVTGGALHNIWSKVRHLLPAWATPHDLRHYYASLLIHEGCSIKQVQRVLGHEKATTTLDTYAHLWPDSDDDLRDAISRQWNPEIKVEATTLSQ